MDIAAIIHWFVDGPLWVLVAALLVALFLLLLRELDRSSIRGDSAQRDARGRPPPRAEVRD